MCSKLFKTYIILCDISVIGRATYYYIRNTVSRVGGCDHYFEEYNVGLCYISFDYSNNKTLRQAVAHVNNSREEWRNISSVDGMNVVPDAFVTSGHALLIIYSRIQNYGEPDHQQ